MTMTEVVVASNTDPVSTHICQFHTHQPIDKLEESYQC